eukprot:187312_1
MATSDYIVSNIDVINNNEWKVGTKCVLFMNARHVQGTVVNITKYDKEFETPHGKIYNTMVIGKVGVEFHIQQNRQNKKQTAWFVIHKKSTGVTFLLGPYSMQGVPNSQVDVQDRNQIVGGAQQAVINPYTTKSGLPLQIKTRMIFHKTKLQKFQSEHNQGKIKLTDIVKQSVDEHLNTINDHLIDG